jgi:colanic acid/amylovoran biosynthesis glycosyltransferase
MRIGIITYFFPKITETFILNRITGLIDRGVEVEIIARKNPAVNLSVEDTDPETLVHPAINSYNLLDKTTYLSENSAFELDKILIDKGIDIAHFQWEWLGEVMLSQRELWKPVFVNVHGVNIPANWNLPDEVAEYKNILNKATLVLPTSNFLREALLSKGGDSEKLVIHYTGVDTNFFFPNRNKRPDKKINILTNGSFIEKKGHEYSLTSVGLLLSRGITNFHFSIIGDGVLKSKYDEIISQYKLQDHVTFLGKLTSNQVAEKYRESDIFILPSVVAADGSHEGIPLAIMEASASALPVVSTFHTGIPEVVDHNVSGVLVKERDSMVLADAVERLIASEELRVEMGIAGRKIIEDRFNLNKLIDQNIELYKKYL